MCVSDSSITVTIMLEKKQNAEVMLLVSLSMSTGGESSRGDISFHCLTPWGSYVTARIKLQLFFGQNLIIKDFPAIFVWVNTDVIVQWTAVFQNVTDHYGVDGAL